MAKHPATIKVAPLTAAVLVAVGAATLVFIGFGSARVLVATITGLVLGVMVYAVTTDRDG